MSGVEIFKVIGAGAFGAMIGWFVYYINRYRTGEVSFADITTLVGTIGGAAILALFKQDSTLFAGYGIGLFAGFFTYFIVLNMQVRKSANFDVDWFIDGRRKKLAEGYFIPSVRQEEGGIGMSPRPEGDATFRGPRPESAAVVMHTSGDVTVTNLKAADQPQSLPADGPKKGKSS